MTWRAFLAEPVHKDHVATEIVVLVHYYDADDAANVGVGAGPPIVAPSAVLHAKAFTFPASTPRGVIQGAIVAEGQDARDAMTKAAAINAQIPVGSTIPIS